MPAEAERVPGDEDLHPVRAARDARVLNSLLRALCGTGQSKRFGSPGIDRSSFAKGTSTVAVRPSADDLTEPAACSLCMRLRHQSGGLACACARW